MCATGSCLDDDDSFGGVEDDDEEAVDEVVASRSDVGDIVGSCLGS